MSLNLSRRREDVLENLLANVPDEALCNVQETALVVAGAASLEKMTKDSEDDYEFSRKTIKGLIEKSEEAIDLMQPLVEGSENPRAFEVYSNMIRDTIDATKRLQELQKERRRLNTQLSQGKGMSVGGAPQSAGTINNNVVFVGTTSDLQTALKNPEILKQIQHGRVIEPDESIV